MLFNYFVPYIRIHKFSMNIKCITKKFERYTLMFLHLFSFDDQMLPGGLVVYVSYLPFGFQCLPMNTGYTILTNNIMHTLSLALRNTSAL